MSVRSLVDLPLAQTTNPIPTSTVSFYQNNLALGSGPNGTWLMTDFFGTTAGSPHTAAMTEVNEIIAKYMQNGTLDTLKTCYDRMRTLLTGGYGAPPTITVPAGPGSGSYADYDSALDALITAANGALNTAASTMGQDLDTINEQWYAMTNHTFVYEPENLTRAEINFATIPAASQLSCTSFITTIDGYGQQVEEGQAAFVLQSVARTDTVPGQAMLGAMIEGRNQQALDQCPLTRWNDIPSQPTSPPPAAPLMDASLTVTQAREAVQSRLRVSS